MSDRELTVFLVDDNPAVLDSLSLLIASEGHPVQCHASAEAFLAACGPESWGCAVIDVRMPDMGGLSLQEEMARRGIRLPIIFLTGHGDIPTSVRAMKAGAFDFLTKPVAGSDLLRSIDVALAEAKRRCAEEDRNCTATSRVASLTARERDVLGLAAKGLANKEIGQRLGISFRTVEIHRARVMHKLGAASLIDLANIARDSGVAE